MSGCLAVTVIQVCVMDGQICDLVYAATEEECKLLLLVVAWLEL